MTKHEKGNFFKYLLDNQNDDWGIILTTAGYYHAPRHEKYPPAGHPESHAFEWEKGRKLDGYYIIYVPTGTGYFETKNQSIKIHAGDALLIYSDDWHRYKPEDTTGWEEYWVGFKGSYIEQYVLADLFPQKESYLKKVGYQPEVVMLFNQLTELFKKETPILKKVAFGYLLQIIAYFTMPTEEKTHTHRDSFLVTESMAYIRQHLSDNIDFQHLAQSFNMSYSRYRSIFKNNTGLAPHQFLINERIECARRLLANTEMSIKEIAYKSGFPSPPYFSRIFQQKTGVTPSRERERRT